MELVRIQVLPANMASFLFEVSGFRRSKLLFVGEVVESTDWVVVAASFVARNSLVLVWVVEALYSGVAFFA
jgi:hypothetical protein